MFINYTKSLYSEDKVVAEHAAQPQMIHQITDGGMAYKAGVKTMPGVLVDGLLGNSVVQTIKQLCPDEERNGLILAAGGTIWTGYVTKETNVDITPRIKVMPISMNQIFAGKCANLLGKYEYVSTDSSSCVSGHAALHQASMLLKTDELDNVTIISVDNATSQEYLNFFAQQGLVKLLDKEEMKFNIGQGANVTVVSNYNKSAIASLDGIGFASEKHNTPLGITETGDGYRKAIENATRTATQKPDVIKTHATFSIDNEIEEKIVKELYPSSRIVNYKLRIGHTMGASTAIEFDLALQELNPGEHLLSLGAGMGNVFTAAKATKL